MRFISRGSRRLGRGDDIRVHVAFRPRGYTYARPAARCPIDYDRHAIPPFRRAAPRYPLDENVFPASRPNCPQNSRAFSKIFFLSPKRPVETLNWERDSVYVVRWNNFSLNFSHELASRRSSFREEARFAPRRRILADYLPLRNAMLETLRSLLDGDTNHGISWKPHDATSH